LFLYYVLPAKKGGRRCVNVEYRAMNGLFTDLRKEMVYVLPLGKSFPVLDKAIVHRRQMLPNVIEHELLEGHILGFFCVFVYDWLQCIIILFSF